MINQQELRTYKRRVTTRESGYHTCEEITGGECLVLHSQELITDKDTMVFTFNISNIKLIELFEKGFSIIAFGGYIHSKYKAEISLSLYYYYEKEKYSYGYDWQNFIVNENSWANIGCHTKQSINIDENINDATVKMVIRSKKGNILNFISFDFNSIDKEEFLDISCAESFEQKTMMHVPYLYYLDTEKSITNYLTEKYNFTEGKRVIMKSCNRCGRYLPINTDDETKTLSFSLHCKKNAPCKHSTFRAYEIQNKDRLTNDDLKGLTLEKNKVISYYGHQLECKACKKFFVNAPLNPLRNPQQFKEDGLRRRAIEVLVNNLLKRNLVHFEFEKKTKKEFSKYIWEKFNKRCFKCGRDSNELPFNKMALDHTMPLAYLYRLDETATCLCASHNSQKSDHFPIDYYTEDELDELSKITGLKLEILKSQEINMEVLDLLVKNIVWFYDVFLMKNDYQKVRDGILTADKINDSLKRVIKGKIDLAEEYKKIQGHYPTSVTIIQKK